MKESWTTSDSRGSEGGGQGRRGAQGASCVVLYFYYYYYTPNELEHWHGGARGFIWMDRVVDRA